MSGHHVRLTTHVVGHVSRRRRASALAADLAPATLHLDNGSLGTWHNHRRALAAAATSDASHVVILEDDATPISNFLDAAWAVARRRPNDLIGLYVGKQRPSPGKVERAVRRAEQIQADWLVCDELLWAVGYMLPVAHIPALLAAADTYTHVATDRRLGAAWRAVSAGWPVVYTWPSLVDHYDQLEQTTSEHPDREPGRVAHRVGLQRGNEQSVRIEL